MDVEQVQVHIHIDRYRFEWEIGIFYVEFEEIFDPTYAVLIKSKKKEILVLLKYSKFIYY